MTEFLKNRKNETIYSIFGLLAGSIAGPLLIGGVGVAALGGAIGISGSVILGATGLIIGNKVGSELDRSKNSYSQPPGK